MLVHHATFDRCSITSIHHIHVVQPLPCGTTTTSHAHAFRIIQASRSHDSRLSQQRTLEEILLHKISIS